VDPLCLEIQIESYCPRELDDITQSIPSVLRWCFARVRGPPTHSQMEDSRRYKRRKYEWTPKGGGKERGEIKK